MSLFFKTLTYILFFVATGITIFIISYFVYSEYFYNREITKIEKALNSIESVEILNIWGHKDISLEEVSARIRIKDKGEVVLYGLSKDVFNYPYHVPIREIGGYTFTTFSCNGGIGSHIDIGTQGELFHFFNKEFNTIIGLG